MKNLLLLGVFLYSCIGIAQAPTNDECSNAIPLSVSANTTCTTSVQGTTLNATASSQDVVELSGIPNDDVWFYFEATQRVHKLDITNITSVGGNSTDMGIAVYSGDCDDPILIVTSDPESFIIQNLEEGTLYYIRVYGWREDSNAMNFTICLTSPQVYDIPINDECENAISIPVSSDLSCDQPTNGTTGGATTSIQDISGATGEVNNDVWFKFEATQVRHQISITNIQDLYGQYSVDLGIAVYAGSCDVVDLIGTSDPEEFFINNLEPGNEYLIRVYGWRNNTNPANFTICVLTGYIGEIPVNDECENAIDIPVNEALTCDFFAQGLTGGATRSSQDSSDVVGTPNDDVWFSFTATQSIHKVEIRNAVNLDEDYSTDLVMTFYRGNCSSMEMIESSDPESVRLEDLEVGETYLVRVYSYSQSSVPISFDICVASPIVDFDIPENDECDNAIVLEVNTNYSCAIKTSGTTGGATASNQSTEGVSGTPNNDVWFSFVATSTFHRIVLDNIVDLYGENSSDMGLAVYTADCSNPALIGSEDFETYNISNLEIGSTYYVRVYGWREDSNPMSFDICIGRPQEADAPINDDCDNAITLTVNNDYLCGNVTSGTTLGGTPSGVNSGSPSGTPNNDVWYTFTAQFNTHRISLTDIVNLDNEGSTDMGIAVYTNGCDDLTFLGTSDPETYNVNGLIPGNDYFVRVYGWRPDANPMSFNICIGSPDVNIVQPDNDDCENAVTLDSNSEDCSNKVSGTTAGASPSNFNNEGITGNPTDDVWYSFTATSNNYALFVGDIVNISGGSSTDMAISVYSGSCENSELIITSDPERFLLSNLTIGEDYLIRVYTYYADDDPVSFSICLTKIGEIPDNDDCSGAIMATLPYNVTQTATAATNNDGFAGCTSDKINDGVWYSFIGTGENITITLNPFSWDPELGIYTGSCGNFNCVASIDDNGADGEETYSFVSQLGTTYYINVGYYSAFDDELEGEFTLSITGDLAVGEITKEKVKLYPNPVNSILNVDYIKNISSIQVFNIVGQEVISRNLNSDKNQIDVSHLSSGSYIVKVSAEDGVQTFKVMKQ